MSMLPTNRSTIPELRVPSADEKPKGILDFIEHPLTLTALFALGGLVGTLFYTPLYVLCAICLLLGLHRSGYVSPQPVRVQVAIYLIAAILLSVGGYFLYELLDIAVQRIQDDFARKVAILVKEKPTEVAKKEPPSQLAHDSTKKPPSETHLSESPKPLPNAKPLKESPLQIVAFDSLHSIAVTNNDPITVHAMELVVAMSEPFYSMSFQLDRDIKAGDTITFAMQGGSPDARTISLLADNWKDHVQKAKQLYSGCGGIQLVFFSPSDSRLEQLKAAHSRNPTRLAYGDASGTLSYLVHGLAETKEEQVPLVAVTTVSNKCPYLN